jgi:hypothetical protein
VVGISALRKLFIDRWRLNKIPLILAFGCLRALNTRYNLTTDDHVWSLASAIPTTLRRNKACQVDGSPTKDSIFMISSIFRGRKIHYGSRVLGSAIEHMQIASSESAKHMLRVQSLITFLQTAGRNWKPTLRWWLRNGQSRTCDLRLFVTRQGCVIA